MAGMVGNILMTDKDAKTDDIKEYLAMGQYSAFVVGDCQSAQCNAFSIECSEYDEFSVKPAPFVTGKCTILDARSCP